MAENKVLFEIIATAKGVKVVQKQTDDLANSTTKADNATKKLGKSRDNYNRREKGAAQISSNSTKNFSKMQQSVDGGGGGGGLVRAYALLAANVFALSAAFGVLSRSAQVDTLVESMQILSTTGGQNIENLSRKMQAASGGAIDLAQSFRQVSLASSAGLETKEIEGLTMVAKGAALSLGRDLPDAMDRIFRGAIKLEPEILDEIGLFVRVDEAAAKYAQTIGKSASSLTQIEKRQAFLNEILEQGTNKFAEYAEGIDPDPYVKLSSALFDLAQGALSFVNAGLGPVIKFLTNNPNLLAAAFASLVVFLMSKAIPALGVFNMNAAAGAAAAISDEQEYLAQIQATMATKENAARADNLRRQEELAGIRKINAERDAKGDGVYNIGGKDAAKQQGVLTKLNRKNVSDKTRADALDQRLAALKSSRAKATKTETVAAINAEIAAREKQQQELREEIRLRKDLANIPVTGKPDKGSLADRRMIKLEGKAASSGMIANATGIAETKGLKAGFKDLTDSFKKGSIEIDGVERKLGKTSKTMHFLKGGTSILGVGFQKLTMMMGPAMMALAFLTPLMIGLSKAIGFGGKEAKIFEESLKTLNTQMDGLDLRLNSQTRQMNDGKKSFIEANKAAIAFMKTIRETNDALIAAEQDQQDYRSSINFLVRGFDNLKNMDSSENILVRMFGRISGLNVITRFLDSSNEQLQEPSEKSAQLTIGGAAKSGDSALLKQIRELIPLTKEQDDALNTLEKSTQDLADGQDTYNEAIRENSRLRLIAKKGENSNQSFNKAMRKEFGFMWRSTTELTDAERRLIKVRFDSNRAIRDADKTLKDLNVSSNQAVILAQEQNELLEEREKVTEAMNSAMMGSKDAVNNFMEGLLTKTPMDEMVSTIDQLSAAFKDIDKEAQEKFFEKFDDEDFFLNKVIDKETIAIIKQGGEEAEKALKGVSDSYHEIQRGLIMNKGEQKAVNNQVKIYNKLLGISTANINNLVKGLTKQKKLARDLDIINRNMSSMGLKLNKLNRKENDDYLINLFQQGKTLTENLKTVGETLGAEVERTEVINETIRAITSQNAELAFQVQLQTESEQKAVKRLAVGKQIFDLEQKLRDEKQKGIALDEKLFNQKVGGSFVEQTSMQKATAEIEAAKFAVTQAILKRDIAMSVIAAEYALLKAQMNVFAKDEKNTGISQADADKFGEDLDKAAKLAEATFEQQITNLEKKSGIALNNAVKTAFGNGDIISGLLVGGNNKRALEQQIEKFKEENPNAGKGVTTSSSRFIDIAKNNPLGITLDKGEGTEGSGVKMGAGSEALAVLEEKLRKAKESSDQFRMSLMTLGETLKGLGPQGEMVAAFAAGGLSIMNTLSQQKQNVEDMTKAYKDDEGLTEAQRETAIAGGETALKLSAAGSIISSIGGMMAANSKAQMAELDGQIEAEKKRDGKSKESLAKIASMEKKKESMKRKAFEADKKMKMAQTVMSTAAAMMAAASAPPGLPITMPNVIMAAAMGAVQLAVISQMKYSGGATSAPTPPSTSMNIGKRENKVDVSRGANSGELNFARGGKGSGSGMGSFSGSGAAGMKSYAAGGSVLVGERGPEIVTPMAPMEVTPNDKIGGGVQNINFSINAVDSAGVEDLLVNQRGNIIRMIREAANDTGERFLETVDTQAYGSSS